MPRFTILQTKAAPHGMGENVIGLVSFGFEPGKFDEPVKFTRYVAPPPDSPAGTKGTNYDVAIITEAAAVKVIDAVVANGTRGPYLQSSAVVIPRDIADGVALQAAAMIDANHRRAAAANPEGRGRFDPPGDPFAVQTPRHGQKPAAAPANATFEPGDGTDDDLPPV